MKDKIDYYSDFLYFNQFEPEEVIVVTLRKLVESIDVGPVSVFDLHEQKNLAPVIVFSLLSVLLEKGVVAQVDEKYFKGEGFVSWLGANRSAIFNSPQKLNACFSFFSEVDTDPPDLSEDLVDI